MTNQPGNYLNDKKETAFDPAEEAVAMTEELLRFSRAETSFGEAAQMARLARMIAQPSAKRLSLLMTDRIGRTKDGTRMARSWRTMVAEFANGAGFSPLDFGLLELGRWWSHVFPGLTMRAVQKRLDQEIRDVILPAEDIPLSNHLSRMSESGTKVNLNQLGEAVLGEKEAKSRLASAIDLLHRRDVDYVSVKISAIYSQINLAARQDSLSTVKNRLRKLYRVALEEEKFVNLDMEAYHDFELTIDAFREVLSEEEFTNLPAGIALQSYLPDAIRAQKELTEWAISRCARGGSPIKIRLVKGANLAMENVEAELHGWFSPTYSSKHESDACFKKMLEYACRPEHAQSVRLGVGSHNLFDIALALVLREHHQVENLVEIEMIQGMAPAQARAVHEKAHDLLLYSPIVKREQQSSALAYLIRRLDENTAPGNFLSTIFSLKPGSEEWITQRNHFLQSWEARETVHQTSHRSTLPTSDKGFANVPDTDWTQKLNRSHLIEARLPTFVVPRAGEAEIETALERSLSARKSWRNRSSSDRAGILRACADQLAESRFETIALLREEGKKATHEADSEISEAIDFANYYAETGFSPRDQDSEPLGTVVVTPPWNFPFAIPCGGVLAALMAGNTVILKPAPETTRIGWWLVQQLWLAGVPEDVLQFVACSDGAVGRRLIEDPRTSAVVLTGAFETARKFRDWRPSLKLFAETSGKNAIVVSALADRELAARDLIQSAFGHSGQKCSAASLGILEREVYEDGQFLDLLRDAASSLAVGPATNPASRITPLVQEPGRDLQRALTKLDPGEEWLLQPEMSESDPCLWSPGIRMGVKEGSWFHQTECFGPVLGLMKAEDLEEAVTMQNGVRYGLTAGFHSLDESEIAEWKERVEAGNLYVNRGTTGAIVRRQPFGGWKRSSIGPGSKAGGPNYVNLFRRFNERSDPDLDVVQKSYQEAWTEHFAKEHDPSELNCESNLFRYRPRRGILLRLDVEDDSSERIAKIAATVCGVPLITSYSDEESDAELADRLTGLRTEIDIVRTTRGAPSDILLRAIASSDLNWIDAPLSENGRLELTRWMKEQSVSETMHRYGNITPRIGPGT